MKRSGSRRARGGRAQFVAKFASAAKHEAWMDFYCDHPVAIFSHCAAGYLTLNVSISRVRVARSILASCILRGYRHYLC